MQHAVALLAALLLAQISVADAAAPAGKPNIVFILADDLGAHDLGCYGSTFYETPNLDRFAREGARFTQAYAACPVCSPTRASYLTGKWPVRTWVTDYIGAAEPEDWGRNTKLIPASYADRLALSEVTLPKVLKAAGYATMHAGKWHLGPEGYWPENQGYDVNKGGCSMGGPYGGKNYFSPYGNPRLSDGPPGEHLDDRLAAECVKFIEANKDRPFFVSFCPYDVHTPLMTRDALRAKYEAKRERLGIKEEWGREGTREVRLVQGHAVYAGMVETIDLAAGKVLRKIDELGLRDKTLVIFTSDNGGLSTSEGSPTSNLPLRGGKGWLYEGGIREPLLVRWPDAVRPGAVIDAPVCTPDFFPTLIEAAGAKLPADYPGDGMSLVALFKGATLPQRPLFWHYPHYGNQGGAPGSAIRLGDWKLIEWEEGPQIELFDLAADEREKHDLAGREPAKMRELLARLHAWQKEMGASFATPNPNYDPTQPDGRREVLPAPPATKPAKVKPEEPTEE